MDIVNYYLKQFYVLKFGLTIKKRHNFSLLEMSCLGLNNDKQLLKKKILNFVHGLLVLDLFLTHIISLKHPAL